MTEYVIYLEGHVLFHLCYYAIIYVYIAVLLYLSIQNGFLVCTRLIQILLNGNNILLL